MTHPGGLARDLTQARLKELLVYKPQTGVFEWLVGKGAGTEAGGKDKKNGYMRIKVDGVLYRTHRLAWLYMTGAFPIDHVDHRDGDRTNNRWANLRPAVIAENNQNSWIPRSNSVSGVRGVSWYPLYSKWRAVIGIQGKTINIGYFDSIEEAAAAYTAKKIDIHPFASPDYKKRLTTSTPTPAPAQPATAR